MPRKRGECVTSTRLILPDTVSSMECPSNATSEPTSDPTSSPTDDPTVTPPEPPGGGCSGSVIARNPLTSPGNLLLSGATPYMKVEAPNLGLRINEWHAVPNGLLPVIHPYPGYFSGLGLSYAAPVSGAVSMGWCDTPSVWPVGAFEAVAAYDARESAFLSTLSSYEEARVAGMYTSVGVPATCMWIPTYFRIFYLKVIPGIPGPFGIPVGGSIEGKWGFGSNMQITGTIEPLNLTITGTLVAAKPGNGGPMWSRGSGPVFGLGSWTGNPGQSVFVPCSSNPWSVCGTCPVGILSGGFRMRISANPE